MNCWFCGEKMIWWNDSTYEDNCIEGDGMVAEVHCTNDDCKSKALFYIEN